MSANIFGSQFQVMSFGESHGPAMGVVIDGCPAGVQFDYGLLLKNLRRRRPGQSEITSPRSEDQEIEILSGIFEGITLGTPIAMLTLNKDAKSEDYEKLKKQFRPGHADDVWQNKYGHRDFRGGGRASGRETVSRVMAGSLAQMFVKSLSDSTFVTAYVDQIGEIKLSPDENLEDLMLGETTVEKFEVRMPHAEKSRQASELLIQAKETGKSYGGGIRLVVENPPINLGQPVFKKLKSEFASAFMGVGSVTGVEFGYGFEAIEMEGSQFHQENQKVYGGIRGGISTGENISFRIAFKPTSTIGKAATTGRHDPCIVPRAVPVLEAMAWIVLADQMLLSRSDQA